MKKLFSLIATIVIISSVFSQSPEKMSYQAVIRNNSNDLVTKDIVGMKISILQGSAEGTVVYAETQSPETNANGLVSIEIGTGTTSNDFSTIDWTNGPYYLKTETDPNGGANYTIVGTSQLLSVPFALYSETAGNVFSGNYNDLINQPVLFDGTWASLSSKPSFATVATSGSYNDLTDKPTLFNGTWENITGKPTTLAGYGITDGMNTSHVANGITSSLITNWNTANSWGDHDGLYRPIGYVPAWNEVTGKPTFAPVATSGSYTDLTNTPTIESSQWTTSGSNIYYNSGNVGIGTSSPATYIHAHGSPITSRGQLSLSAPSGEGIFLSFYDADIFKAYLWYDVSDEDLRLQNFTAGDLNLNPYGGNVGIGKDNPGYELDVTGDINFTGSLYQNGSPITAHYIGEFYGGGIVFWLDESGQHCLICAKEDQSSGVRWYAGTNGNTQAEGDGPFSGEANTSIIIAAHVAIGDDDAPYAARICNELQITEGGKTYGDWYLPSKEELNLMYQNRATINTTATANGGSVFVAVAEYWSSTERSNDSRLAWSQYLGSGLQLNSFKVGAYRVRAVRAF